MPGAIAVGSPQIILFLALSAAFAALLLAAALRKGRTGPGERRRFSSLAGLVLQGLGCAIAGFGPIDARLDPLSIRSLLGTALVLVGAGSAVALFAWSTRTMGRNWSLVARTRGDHELVRTGPFALVRHPIYLALLLYLLSIAAAFGHWLQLVAALPVYLAGTAIRIRDEEVLLRQAFGGEHDRYAATTPALLRRLR